MVPPRMFACGPHWAMVPPVLQQFLWAVYRPGQENDKQPTKLYLAVQIRCRIAIADREDRDIVRLVADLRRLLLSTESGRVVGEILSDEAMLAEFDLGLPKLIERRQRAAGAT